MDPSQTNAPRDSTVHQRAASSDSTDNPSKNSHNVTICSECGRLPGSRNLVVCLDGTSNKFGLKNTMIVQLYQYIRKYGSRYETTTQPAFEGSEDSAPKDDDEILLRDNPDCSHCGQYFEQLTYYNSGIGTYAADDTIKSPLKYMSTLFKSAGDMALAWNVEEIVQRAYHCLSDNHHPGDRIYIFGFSRGAYQVRTLAGMIHEIGLIFRGNVEQIPFAYEVYANKSAANAFKTFRRAFSRRDDIRIHFIGIWDCVASVGLFENIDLPSTKFASNVDYYRHALALDERRVKFIPEFVGEWSESEANAIMTKKRDKSKVSEEKQTQRLHKARLNHLGMYRAGPRPKSKEVWFIGKHSDVGGGNEENADLERPSVSLGWMMHETTVAGLKFNEPEEGHWQALPGHLFTVHKPHRGFSVVPLGPCHTVKWRDYDRFTWGSKGVRKLYRFRHRTILTGQMMHITSEIRNTLDVGWTNGPYALEHFFRTTFSASYELEWLDKRRIMLLVDQLIGLQPGTDTYEDEHMKVSGALRIVAVTSFSRSVIAQSVPGF